MIEMLLAIVVVGLILLAMSVGVIMGRTPIKGSCGGVAAALGEQNYVCDICGGDPDKCENPDAMDEDATLGYNVAKSGAK